MGQAILTLGEEDDAARSASERVAADRWDDAPRQSDAQVDEVDDRVLSSKHVLVNMEGQGGIKVLFSSLSLQRRVRQSTFHQHKSYAS